MKTYRTALIALLAAGSLTTVALANNTQTQTASDEHYADDEICNAECMLYLEGYTDGLRDGMLEGMGLVVDEALGFLAETGLPEELELLGEIWDEYGPEALLDSEDFNAFSFFSLDEGMSFEDRDFSFEDVGLENAAMLDEAPTYLAPSYLPEGYAFQEAMEHTLPAMEPQTEMYVSYGDSEGETFLELIYHTIPEAELEIIEQEMAQELAEEPEAQTLDIAGKAIYLFTEDDGLFSTAFFNHAQGFITINSDLSQEELVKVIESLPNSSAEASPAN